MRGTSVPQHLAVNEEIELTPTHLALKENIEKAINDFVLDPCEANKKNLNDFITHFELLTTEDWRELGIHCKNEIAKLSEEIKRKKLEILLISIYHSCQEENDFFCSISYQIFKEPVHFYQFDTGIWSKTYEKEVILKYLDKASPENFKFPSRELSFDYLSPSLKTYIQENLIEDKKKLTSVQNFISFFNAMQFIEIEQYKPEGYIPITIREEDFYILFDEKNFQEIENIFQHYELSYIDRLLHIQWSTTYVVNHRHNLSFPIESTQNKNLITYMLESNLDVDIFNILINRIKNEEALKKQFLSLFLKKEDHYQDKTPIERLCQHSLHNENSKEILLLLIKEFPKEMSHLLSLKDETNNPIFNTLLETSLFTYQSISKIPEAIQAASLHHLLSIFTDKIDDFETPNYKKCLENFKQLLVHLGDMAKSQSSYFHQTLDGVLQKSAKEMGGTFFFFGVMHEYTKAKHHLSLHSFQSLKKWLHYFKCYVDHKHNNHSSDNSNLHQLFKELYTALNPEQIAAHPIISPSLRH